jgi:hypothetical protein
MFEHIILLGLNFKEIFLLCILGLLCVFLGVFVYSLYHNRNFIHFYSLAVRENGRISKVGLAFIFILSLLVYQIISEAEVSFYLVELLGIIFAAELGTKYVDGRLTQRNIDTIKKALTNVDTKKSESAKDIDDIDFDKL